jgi:hypothetical protein
MRFSRPIRVALILVLVLVTGGFGPALDGVASLAAAFQAPPSMQALLDWDTQTFRVDAVGGQPGSVGSFNFLVVSGLSQGLFTVPFTFDSSGRGSFVVPTSALITEADLAVAIQLVAYGNDGLVHASPLWALGSHSYLVTDPQVPPCDNCPTTPGCDIEWIPWPGTFGSPEFPHCTLALPIGEERASGQPMLALESGPAGSFPIN